VLKSNVQKTQYIKQKQHKGNPPALATPSQWRTCILFHRCCVLDLRRILRIYPFITKCGQTYLWPFFGGETVRLIGSSNAIKAVYFMLYFYCCCSCDYKVITQDRTCIIPGVQGITLLCRSVPWTDDHVGWTWVDFFFRVCVCFCFSGNLLRMRRLMAPHVVTG